MTSGPPVIASPALPEPYLLFQPRPISSMGAARAGGGGAFHVPSFRVARVGEPLRLGAPVHSLIGLPHIGAPAAEAERLEAHRLERDIAGEDHQVPPRDLASVLLLDRPKQPACLVEVRVVRPRVEWRESLLAGARAAATGADAVGGRRVARHSDAQAPVVAVIRGPPVLAVRHERAEVLLQRP